DAVFLPGGLVEELAQGLGVAVADQVAGHAPALGIDRGIAPGGAVVFALAGQELQVERRAIETILLREVDHALPGLAHLRALEEELLLGDGFVSEAGCNQKAVDADLLEHG